MNIEKSASKPKEVTYPLRLPAELKRWVQEKAASNRRSFNSEVVVSLENLQKSEVVHAQT